MQEEVVKVQSGLSLDLNLEKSRIKEEVKLIITLIGIKLMFFSPQV